MICETKIILIAMDTMENSIHVPLDLPHTRRLKVSNRANEDWLIEVESTLNHTYGDQCGQDIPNFHGPDKPIHLRHLPLFSDEGC